MQRRNLQLLFDRPSEPIFTQKGDEGVVFDVPSHYLVLFSMLSIPLKLMIF